MGLRGSIVTLAAALILSAIVSDQLLVVAYNNGLARLPPMYVLCIIILWSYVKYA